MKIIAGMFAVGDPLYRQMANISIPSFCRANLDQPLVFFTDDLGDHPSLEKFKMLKLESFYDWFNHFQKEAAEFDRRIEHPRCDVQYPTHFHSALFLAVFPLMLQAYAEKNGFEWAMMLDVDSYFVGDLIKKFKNDVGFLKHKHLFVVDQSHPEMGCSEPEIGTPGAGFQVWKVDSPYIQRYTMGFHVNHQTTFHSRTEDLQYLRHVRLIYPGYHMVYPFSANANFSKEDAIRLSPAYFHLGIGNGGPPVMSQLEKFDDWFNPERR